MKKYEIIILSGGKGTRIKKFTKNIDFYIRDSNNFIVNENYKAFIKLDKFSDSSIDILIYCFTSTNDWETFLKTKEEIPYSSVSD